MAVTVIDTANLGPIRIEPDADAARARIVRQALLSIGDELFQSYQPVAGSYANAFAMAAGDAALAKLGRMLK